MPDDIDLILGTGDEPEIDPDAGEIGIKSAAHRRAAAKRAEINLLRTANAARTIAKLPDAGEALHMIVAADFTTIVRPSHSVIR